MFKSRKFLIFFSILALTAILLTGCGKKEAATKNDGDAAATQNAPAQPALDQSEMDHLRSSLGFMSKSSYENLEGVPLYVGSTEIDDSRSLNGNVLTASFSIIAQIDEFTTFYEREFPNSGWNIVKKQVTDTTIKLEATKSGRLATISANIEDGTIKEYKVITD